MENGNSKIQRRCTCPRIRTNSVSIHAEKLFTHFSKGLHRILTSVTCLHRRTYLPTPNTYLYTDTYTHTFQHIHSPTHTSSYMYTTYKQHPPPLRTGGWNKLHFDCNFESVSKEFTIDPLKSFSVRQERTITESDPFKGAPALPSVLDAHFFGFTAQHFRHIDLHFIEFIHATQFT